MENFKKQYRDLKQRVISELRNKVEKSEYISKHSGAKAIEVEIFDYTELTIVNDKLTFINDNGYKFSLFADTNLEDLIDILSEDL